MSAAEDIAKVLTAIGASGIATMVTAITTVLVSSKAVRLRKMEKESDEISKDWLRQQLAGQDGKHSKPEPPPEEEPTGEN